MNQQQWFRSAKQDFIIATCTGVNISIFKTRDFLSEIFNVKIKSNIQKRLFIFKKNPQKTQSLVLIKYQIFT